MTDSLITVLQAMTFVIGIVIWLVLGAGVLVLIDDEDESLYCWYASAPYPWICVLVLLLWPVVVWAYQRD